MRLTGFAKTVGGASLVVLLFNILNKAFGFAREIVFASSFGISHNFDLLLVGTAVPLIISSATFYTVQNYFIPLYNTICLKEDRAAGLRFTAITGYQFSLASAAVTILLWIVFPTLLSLFFGNGSNNDNRLIFDVFRISIAAIPFSTLISVYISYLYAEFRFLSSSLILVIPNILIIIGVFLCGKTTGIIVIPIANGAGIIIQSMILYFLIKPPAIRSLRFSGLKEYSAGQSLAAIIIIEIMGQLYILIDRLFYPLINPGGIAAINYASMIFILPVQVIALTFSTILFSKISKEVAEYGVDGAESSIRIGISLLVYIFLPVSVMMYVFSGPIINIIYHRGSFDARAVQFTIPVLQMFSLSLAGYGLYAILNKVFFGLRKSHLILIISLAAFSVKLLANLITVHALKEIGLALSTSISYLIMFSLSCLFLRKMSILKKLLPLAVELLVICINILFSLLLTYAFWAFQLEWRFHFLSLLIFPAIYVINSLVLKQEIVRLIISRFRSMVSEQKVSVEN